MSIVEEFAAAMGRGYCPVCERWMRLKKDGTLRHHGGPVGSGAWDDYRSYQCKGAGGMPVAPPEGSDTNHG